MALHRLLYWVHNDVIVQNGHITYITSKNNKLIKHVKHLLNDKSYQNSTGQAILLGEHLLIEAQKHHLLKKIFITKDLLTKYQNYATNCEIIVISSEILNYLNIMNTTIKILALIHHKISNPILDLKNNDCVILENIQNPNNLGAILRVVAASGIKMVFLSDDCVGVYNPKVLRASQGIQFELDLYTDYNLKRLITTYPYPIYLTSPNAANSLYDLNLKNNCGFIFGNEGLGISPQLNSLLAKTNQIKIPMVGQVESLNVATAVAICLFEKMRQKLIQC